MRILPLILFLLIISSCNSSKKVASADSKTLKPLLKQVVNYRESYKMIHDLVHTKLHIKPDWNTKRLIGKATITLHPHFYPTDSVTLNARGMFIHRVRLIQPTGDTVSLSYTYDSLLLNIVLDHTYTNEQNYTLHIEYTARPEEIKTGGSAAIHDDKGLYFINADGKDPEKPKQIWTQGETESNSVWFPTIEDPKQKMTQEIYLTVDTIYKTLSNGILVSSALNQDGTRTDYWKQTLPHAPYLTMIAVGDFAIVKDQWRKIPLQYYVEHDYAPYVKMIFGNTPEMMEFFSKKFDVDFPWEKYAQIPVRDFVSGAMENTTAVVHLENMLQTPREYLDGNYEDYIAHELAHHWFGDLVTCESWANITLNEGFANYSEYLWREHKFGRDDADYANQHDQNVYLYASKNYDPDVIRFDYEDAEDMYDYVSYDKGGRILHMLRKYLGDESFFASIKYYLNEHKFSSTEIHDLRLAFEKISGEDLNWFFNQWYLNHGYPILNINYDYDDSTRIQHVTIEQIQDYSKAPLYRLPLAIDIYSNGLVERKKIILNKEKETFHFTVAAKPDLINVDAEKMLLCTKRDNKTRAQYLYQYYHAPLYLDRYEAVSKIGDGVKPGTDEARMMADALKDKFWNIRNTSLKKIGTLAELNEPKLRAEIEKLAIADAKSQVRATALKVLSKYYYDSATKRILVNALNDSSYLVIETAFKQLIDKDADLAVSVAPQLEEEKNAALMETLAKFYADHPKPEYNNFYLNCVHTKKSKEQKQIIDEYGKYLSEQRLELREQGIIFLDSLGRNASSWKIRLSATNSLTELLNKWDKSIAFEDKAKMQEKEDELRNLIKEIKQKETDENLIERYKKN